MNDNEDRSYFDSFLQKKKFIRVEKNFDSFLQKRKIHKHKVSFTPKIKKVQNKISDSFNINDFWNYL